MIKWFSAGFTRQIGKEQFFQQIVLTTLNNHMQKNEFRSFPYIEISLKWIKNLNIRTKNIKCIKENTRQNLHDIEFGDDFLNGTPKV
jgi:hypothetical protein